MRDTTLAGWEYQTHHKYFAQVGGTLEKHAADELEELGAKVLTVAFRGLRFQASKDVLYKVYYRSRLIQRILLPLISFNCHSEKYLYKTARENVDWTALFGPDKVFGVECNVSNSAIKHSLYAGQLLKDAICDCFRDRYGRRPDFSPSRPDILFNLHISANQASIYLDMAGRSMHKRGYRVASVAAPLQETLAAALIRISGWKGDRPLLDPMCGSGTILCEALMAVGSIAPGYLRGDGAVGFMPDHDPNLWQRVKQEADAEIKPPEAGLITGSDIAPESISAARANLANLPGGDKVCLLASRFQDLPQHSEHIVITNPPYGVRLGTNTATVKLYNELGDFLKQRCPRSEAYILCGDASLVKELRLRAHWAKALKNGDLDTKFAKIIMR